MRLTDLNDEHYFQAGVLAIKLIIAAIVDAVESELDSVRMQLKELLVFGKMAWNERCDPLQNDTEKTSSCADASFARQEQNSRDIETIAAIGWLAIHRETELNQMDVLCISHLVRHQIAAIFQYLELIQRVLPRSPTKVFSHSLASRGYRLVGS